MSVIYRAFKGLAAGAAAVSAANAAAIDLAAFAGAGGDLSPKPACRCVSKDKGQACALMTEGRTYVDSVEAVETSDSEEMDWSVLAVRSE